MKRSFLFLGLLFIGSAFANAPVTTLTINTAPAAPPAPLVSASVSDADTAASPVNAPVPQVVNSQEMLASLTPDQRIARLENQVNYLNTYTNQISGLSAQVDVLRGEIEDLNHQISDLQKQVTTLTQAQATLQSQDAKNTSKDSDSATATAVPAAEQAAYQDAYNLMAKKQYAPAIKAFNNFLTKYPKSTLISNVHYWLGDLYLTQGQPDSASKQYRVVISNNDATKRPDAMVKLGTILLAYGDNDNAKTLFQNVIKQYPKSSAATQAKQRLKSIQ